MILTDGVLSTGFLLDAAAAWGATVFLQTGLLCGTGLLVIAALRRYGVLAQSFAARTVLVLTLLTPLSALVSMRHNAVGVQLPAVSPAQTVFGGSHRTLPESRTAVTHAPTPSPIPAPSSVSESQRTIPSSIAAKQPPAFIRTTGIRAPLPETHPSPVKDHPLTKAGTIRTEPEPRQRSLITLVHENHWLHMILYSGGLLVWLCASLGLLLQSMHEYRSLHTLRQQMQPVSANIGAICNRLAAQLDMTPPRIRRIAGLISPVASGIRHPLILLPDTPVVNEKKLEQVLVHELIHLKRHDQIWNHFRQIALILFPLQPLIWSLTRQLDETSDYVCDAVVTARTQDRRAYAETLLEIACQYPRNTPIPGFGAGLFSFASPLRRRIFRIMDAVTDTAPHLSVHTASVVLFICITSAAATGLVGVELRAPKPVAGIIPVPVFATLWNITRPAPDTLSKTKTYANTRQAPDTSGISMDTTVDLPDTDAAIVSGMRASHELVQIAQSTAQSRIQSVAASDTPSWETDTFQAVQAPDQQLTIRPAHQNASSEPLVLHEPVAPEGRELSRERPFSSPAAGTGNHIADARNGMSPASFIARHRGTPMPAVTEQRIVMPVAKAVDVDIPDYQNGMFDLTDEEQKAQYNLYASLDKNKNEPAWSPDGRWIAFTDNNRIWIVPVSGGEPQLIYENYYYAEGRRFPIGGIESLLFSPDGQSLVFKLDTYNTDRGSRVTIKYIDAIRTSAYFELPIPVIVRLDLKTLKKGILADGGYRCALSPDGSKLCYLAANLPDDDNDPSLLHHPILLDLETGESSQLNADPGFVFGRPAFTPDGSDIIITAREGNSAIELYRIPAEGREPECLTTYNEHDGHGKYMGFPVVSPDGEWVLYTDYTITPDRPDKRLMLYSTISGERFEMFPEAEDRRSYGVWSPTGTHICYLATEPGGNVLYICRFEPLMFKITVPVDVEEPDEPLAFVLDEPYPNPFNSTVSIQFTIPDPARVNLVIYNVMGQRIRELVTGQHKPGTFTARWDGCDAKGNTVSSGIYIARIDAGNHVATKKMTLAK